MSTAALDAGDNPDNNGQSKSFGDYAADFGTTLKTSSGKLLSVGGSIITESFFTLVGLMIAFLIIDFIGMGTLPAIAIAVPLGFTAMYVGNGLQGGTWNPLTFAASLFS